MKPSGPSVSNPDAWSEPWDYSQVPEREWEWRWKKDASEHGTSDARVDARGIYWGGELLTGLSKGGYDVAFQSFEEFLEHGPPAGAYDAETHADEVRAHIVSHRRAGSATRARVTVELDGWGGDPRLQSLSVGLSFAPMGRSFDARDHDAPLRRPSLEIWSGTVPAGAHRVSMHVLFARAGDDGYRSRRIDGLTFHVEAGASVIVRVVLRSDLSATLETSAS